MLKSIENNDSNEFNNEKVPTDETVINENNITSENYSLSEEHLDKNNIELSSEIFQEPHVPSDSCETPLKTSSRPQRQAAIKAENQIRVIKKKLLLSLMSYDIKNCILF